MPSVPVCSCTNPRITGTVSEGRFPLSYVNIVLRETDLNTTTDVTPNMILDADNPFGVDSSFDPSYGTRLTNGFGASLGYGILFFRAVKSRVSTAYIVSYTKFLCL